MEKSINTFFFVKQGKSKATVTFDKNVFRPNETTNVKVDIDNTTCDKDITRIKLKLRREIKAKDRKNRSYMYYELLNV